MGAAKLLLVPIIMLSLSLLVNEYLVYHLRLFSCTWPTLASQAGTGNRGKRGQTALRVMVTADLHLVGSLHGKRIDRMRRDWSIKRSFKAAFFALYPDLVLILGDLSDEGQWSSDAEWNRTLKRLQGALGPKPPPMFVLPGNHDIDYHKPADVAAGAGNHSTGLMERFRRTVEESGLRSGGRLGGLSQASPGGGAFKVGGVRFVWVDAMALAGHADCAVCEGAREAVSRLGTLTRDAAERAGVEAQHRIDLSERNRRESEGLAKGAGEEEEVVVEEKAKEDMDGTTVAKEAARPVLLLHLPLFRVNDSACKHLDVPRCGPWHNGVDGCSNVFAWPSDSTPPPQAPYEPGKDTLLQSVSEDLLNELNPRLVLGAHTHRACLRNLPNGALEATVSSFSWRNRDDPTFILATISRTTGEAVLDLCTLPMEHLVLVSHAACAVLSVLWIVSELFFGLRPRSGCAPAKVKAS